MSKLDDFLGRQSAAERPPAPDGVEWFASVACQTCGAQVNEQTLFPADSLLVWECASGHRSYIEGYSAF